MDKEATMLGEVNMVGEGTEVVEVEVVEGAVVGEGDHDIERDNRTPLRRWWIDRPLLCSMPRHSERNMRCELWQYYSAAGQLRTCQTTLWVEKYLAQTEAQ